MNSNRILEALDAYKNALDINPNYVRTRYNLAIACVSLKSYEQAIQHLLSAIKIQLVQQRCIVSKDDRSEKLDPRLDSSDCLWQTLNSVCHIMSRSDLVEKCDHRDLDAFASEYQF